jgi:hypothetical protein
MASASSGPYYRAGGRRQRQVRREQKEQLVAVAVVQQLVKSEIAKHILQKWAWGLYSGAEVQRVAMCHVDDMVALVNLCGAQFLSHVPSDVQFLAGLGTRGRHSNNINKELLAWLSSFPRCKTFETRIETNIFKPRKRQSPISRELMSFLLPHEMFHHLFHHHRVVWNKLFLGRASGETDKLEMFWKELTRRRDPRLQHHPMLQRANWFSKAVMISIHGDAVTCIRPGKAGQKSLDVYSWMGMLGDVDNCWSLYMKHYMFSVFTASVTDNTMDEAWEVLVWSFAALFEAKFPSKNHKGDEYSQFSAEGLIAGQPLADGFFGVVLTIKGDMKFFHEGFDMACATGVDPCDHCPCHRSDEKDPELQVFNFKLKALWKSRLFTPQEWRAMNPEMHRLFVVLYYLSNWNCEPDVLHIAYLGLFQVLIGTVFFIIVYRCLGGNSVESMNTLWTHIREYYTKNKVPCQYTWVSLSSWHDPTKPTKNYPRLKGKGLESKHLLLATLSAMKAFRRPRNQDDLMVVSLLEKLAEIEKIFDESHEQPFVEWEAAMKAQELADEFLELYAKLHNKATANGDLLFHHLPKVHAWWHMVFKARYQHPRLGSTCIDEDFVGRIKRIVLQCSAGTRLHDIPKKVADRFVLGKAFMYSFAAKL